MSDSALAAAWMEELGIIERHAADILDHPLSDDTRVRYVQSYEFHDRYVDRRPYFIFDAPSPEGRCDAFALSLSYLARERLCSIAVLQKLKSFNAKEYKALRGTTFIEHVVDHLIAASRKTLFARDWNLAMSPEAESYQPGIRDRYFERISRDVMRLPLLNANRARVRRLLGVGT